MRFSPKTQTCYPKHIDYQALPPDLIELTNEQLALVRSCRPGEIVQVTNGQLTLVAKPAPTADETIAANAASMKLNAKELLSKSDITLLRCVEHGVNFPPAWVAYRAALRAILNTGAGTLPARPPYPEGT